MAGGQAEGQAGQGHDLGSAQSKPDLGGSQEHAPEGIQDNLGAGNSQAAGFEAAPGTKAAPGEEAAPGHAPEAETALKGEAAPVYEAVTGVAAPEASIKQETEASPSDQSPCAAMPLQGLLSQQIQVCMATVDPHVEKSCESTWAESARLAAASRSAVALLINSAESAHRVNRAAHHTSRVSASAEDCTGGQQPCLQSPVPQIGGS